MRLALSTPPTRGRLEDGTCSSRIPNGPDNLADPGEVRVEQEHLPHRLVVDRRVREANLKRPEVAFADREPAADCPEPLRNCFHVVAEGEVVRQERLETTFECLIVDP